jgi:hypothetical protein
VEMKKDPKIHMPDGKHLSKKRADKIFHLDSRENAADGTATNKKSLFVQKIDKKKLVITKSVFYSTLFIESKNSWV